MPLATTAADLPDYLAWLIGKFPLNCGRRHRQRCRWAHPHVVFNNGIVTLLHEEALGQRRGLADGYRLAPFGRSSTPICPPQPDAQRLARAIRTRFDVTHGALEIMAPGRFDRQEAARGQPAPFA